MLTKTITLHPDDFFHARPAARIAEVSKHFTSVTMVISGTSIADTKNSLSLMRLGHPDGSSIDLMADGPDEQAALEAVVEAIQNEFTLEKAL